jgi:DNA-binding NarL/FixJ family response regulator
MKAKSSNRSEQPPASRAIRIVLADDHVFMRELVTAMLKEQGDRFQVVAEASNAVAAIKACRESQPEIIILDINMPGQSGVDAVPEIKRVSPETRILLCSGSVTEQGIISAIRTGTDGFMEKTSSVREFMDALDRIAQGDNYFCPRSSRLLAEMARGGHLPEQEQADSVLTGREKDVLRLIAQGHTSKDIARKLFLSVATVETHRANLMKKAGARNAAELIRYGLESGLLQLSARDGGTHIHR